MKEYGIIFNADMVRADLAGKKWQTRRPLRIQPSKNAEFCRYGEVFNEAIFTDGTIVKPPYGSIGDVHLAR